jgi:hypothetical protein
MPLTFVKNTFFYEQILRNGQFAIYKQRLNATADKPVRGCLAFEVIKIREKEECVMFDKVVEAHEVGPSNEDFGQFGWSYPTLERAKDKLHLLIAAAELPATSKKGSK